MVRIHPSQPLFFAVLLAGLIAISLVIMPSAAKRPCTHPGCGVLTDGGPCERHRKQQRKEIDERRGSAASRGYGYRWRKTAAGFLRAHPLCQCPDCDEGRKRLVPATVVDHRTPHKGDKRLFWDPNNWQSMAKACHDRKTAREDGRWG